jgi:2-oxoglutarate dehydrogenase E2 component (dihydrolipoamide succinyltransferase)
LRSWQRVRRPEFPSARGIGSKEELRRLRSTPLVRRIATEQGVDISQIQGSGISGRVTKNDFWRQSKTAARARPLRLRRHPQRSAPGTERCAGSASSYKPMAAYAQGDNVRIEPMTIMRKKIAEHMVLSAHTSPHVLLGLRVDSHE